MIVYFDDKTAEIQSDCSASLAELSHSSTLYPDGQHVYLPCKMLGKSRRQQFHPHTLTKLDLQYVNSMNVCTL